MWNLIPISPPTIERPINMLVLAPPPNATVWIDTLNTFMLRVVGWITVFSNAAFTVLIYHCKKGFVILTIVFLTRNATVDMVYGMILE